MQEHIKKILTRSYREKQVMNTIVQHNPTAHPNTNNIAQITTPAGPLGATSEAILYIAPPCLLEKCVGREEGIQQWMCQAHLHPHLRSASGIQVVQFDARDAIANNQVSYFKARRFALAVLLREKGAFGIHPPDSEGCIWAWFYNHTTLAASQGGPHALSQATIAHALDYLTLNPADRAHILAPPGNPPHTYIST